MDRQTAESLAIQALSFLAEDADRIGRFLALTGINPAELRAIAQDPAFLAAVLEHVAGDESLLIALSDHLGRKPGDVAAAVTALAGNRWERDIP